MAHLGLALAESGLPVSTSSQLMTEPETGVEPVASVGIEKRSSFASDVLKLVGGTVMAQVITILTAPILSRLYAPEAYGTLAIFVSIVSIISVIVCMRYEVAIMLPGKDEDAVNLLALSFMIAFVVSGLSAILILIGHQSIVNLLKAPCLLPYLWLVPVALLVQGVFQALNYWNSRLKRFEALSIARVSASVTTSAVPLALGAIGRASTGALVGSWMAGTTVFTTILGGQLWRDTQRQFRDHVRLHRIAESLKRYRKFPLVDSWATFINNISWQLPALMLSAFFTQTVVGYYSLANRVIMLPLTLVGSSIGQVFFQRASEARGNSDDLSKIVQVVFRQLVALGLFPSILLTIAGKELFAVVFGSNWAEAGVYAQILSPWVFVLAISSPLSTLFSVLERQELSLILNVFILTSRIASLMIGGALGDVYIALALWSGTGISVYGGLAIWNMTLAGVSLTLALRIVLKYILYSIPALAIFLVVKTYFQTPIWTVVVAAAVSIIVYYSLILYYDRALYRNLTLSLTKR